MKYHLAWTRTNEHGFFAARFHRMDNLHPPGTRLLRRAAAGHVGELARCLRS